MRVLLIGSMLMMSSAATALPGSADRFVDAKSGYIVESRQVGGWLRLRGRHPDTGSTFRLKVSPGGRVTGLWEGKPLDYRLGAERRGTGLAAAHEYLGSAE